MLSLTRTSLKSFNDDLSLALGTIHLSIKLNNEEDSYIQTKDIFLS